MRRSIMVGVSIAVSFLTATGFTAIGWAQIITPDAAPLAGWHGELKWSLHIKEDTSIPPGTNRSETKFSGEAQVWIHQVDPQRSPGQLRGYLGGKQEVETMWWGYPHGGPYAGQVCRGSVEASHVFAHITGSSPLGANLLSLEVTEVQAKIDVKWSGGGPNVACNFDLPIDNGMTISGLVRSLQPLGDGTYKSGFDTVHGLTEAHWSMVLRPAYCGWDSLQKGGVFAQSATAGSVTVYSEPSSISSALTSVPNTARLIFRETRQVGNQTWFYVVPPGKPAGWVPAKDLACQRPGEPFPIFGPWNPPPYRSTPSYGGGRG